MNKSMIEYLVSSYRLFLLTDAFSKNCDEHFLVTSLTYFIKQCIYALISNSSFTFDTFAKPSQTACIRASIPTSFTDVIMPLLSFCFVVFCHSIQDIEEKTITS